MLLSTRRRHLLVVLALTASVLGLPVLPAHGDAPTARAVQRQVTGWSTSSADGLSAFAAGDAWTVSDSLDATDTVMVGADWGGDGSVEVQIRTRSGRTWGEWTPLEAEDPDHAPDPGTPEAERVDATVSAPIWTGDIDALQVRARGDATPEVTLHEVEIAGGDGLGYVPPQLAAAGAAMAAPSQPDIIRRSAWDPRNQCRRNSPPWYSSDVRFAVVHHTADSNDYAPDQADDRLLAVCLYHTRSRGYDDIAYNFVIDKYGRAYEGRTGGIDQPVGGSHALGFNAGSTGVVLLGTYTSVEPPEPMKNALRDLLAWKLDQHHVDPHGTTTEISGGNTGVYADGQRVTLPTVLGHRDLRSTSCPGGAAHDDIANGTLAGQVAATGGPRIYGGPPPEVDQPVIGARPEFEATFSTSSDWDLTIRNAAGDVVRRTRGTGDAVSRTWDLKDHRGREVAPGTYTATISLPGTDATPVVTEFEVTGSTDRKAGAERISTSVELSRWAFNDDRRAAGGYGHTDTVIIASAESYPDALVATPLAASYHAPILLSRRTALDASVIQEINRLEADHAILVGGEVRLAPALEAQLKATTTVRTVERLAGETRYHTSGRVGWRVVEREGPREALLALGEQPGEHAFADALIAGAFGGAFDLPVLLVQPGDITEPTRWVLEQRGWSRGVSVIGGKGVLDTSVKQAAADASRSSVREFAGDDHYDTSAEVAEELLGRWNARRSDPHAVEKGVEVVLATGENWPDALGAGAAAARTGSAFLLVHDASLDRSRPSKAWLDSHRASTVRAVAAGGPVAVGPGVLADVDRIIRGAGPHTAAPEDW